ncbi:MAG: imidazole glycerol phosphate synthase subunit HisH [Lachnospiraceae bacterium]|nr:imidazole glycerol phosphate synthase subunit HisH [Candidatus Colinaster scatohippi]
MIAVIDYDAGNIKSVEKALESLGAEVVVTRDSEVLLSADKVILPGVGAFGDAMSRLEEYGLVSVIKQIVQKGTPFMGICLGLQLLFDSSEEAPGVKGLGILPGKIVRFSDEFGLKIPQIGWNALTFTRACPVFEGIEDGAFVYFVHSYYLKAENENDVIATCEYGNHVHAAVNRGNVYACQFHPEKSSSVGLKILSNFIDL